MENVNINSQEKESLEMTKVDPAIPQEFLISAAAAQGGRKYMEDRIQIEVSRLPSGELDFIFAAVYDGHGGSQASEYVQKHLFTNIVNNRLFSSNDDRQMLNAIKSGFLKTHNNMKKMADQWPHTTSGFPCTAGTTATCAFIRNGKLYIGHVGDSSIILANFAEEEAGYNDSKLTEDHKPDDKIERQRIERVGGSIATKSGIVRVIWKRPIRGHRGPIRRSTSTEDVPFLAVTRSLGDFWSLNPENNEYVVSPEPDVDVFRLKSTDNFLVIASDGLTNVIGIRTITQVLREVETSNRLQFAGEVIGFDNRFASNHAHALLKHSIKKWGSLRADNISVVCIKLNVDPNEIHHHPINHEDVKMNVGLELTKHPFAMVYVNKDKARLLHTNTLTNLYGNMMNESMNARLEVANKSMTLRRSQLNTKQDHFIGPGLLYHESDFLDKVKSGFDFEAGQSDAEETKNSSRVNTNTRSSSHSGPAHDLGNNVLSNGFYLNDVTAKVQVKDSWNPVTLIGRKRRLNEPDEYERHTNEDGSTRMVVPDHYEEAKPPPLKKSRLQSVMNFFTSLFKW